MGYFDTVKEQKKATTNVTPILRTPAPTGIHPYAHAGIDAELARLDQCRRTPDGCSPHWDETTYEVACNLIELANSPWSGYTIGQARSDYDARAPRDAGFDDKRIDAKWRSAEGKVGSEGRPQPTEQTVPAVTVLELGDSETNAFWSARPLLRHVHTYARARRVSPWATLGVVLTRVVTATPYFVVLPPIVGGIASLNLFVGLVGKSGAGKGAAESVAAELLVVGHVETHTTGSGEGIAHGYMRRTKNGAEWNDDTHAVLFSVPEIDTLSALGNRQGATLMPELRRAWSGERLGFAYADPAKRLPVPAHEYRLCLVAGIQPARARTLIDDADGGTPQRFLWMPATDSEAPDIAPTCPAPLVWGGVDTRPSSPFVTPSGKIRMKVCDVAVKTIDQAQIGRLRGEGEALDGHGLLTRLKVAAALAIAEGRLEVTDEDWHLAGVVHRKSDITRASIQRALSLAATDKNEAQAYAEASRAVKVGELVGDVAIKRVSRSITRKLHKADDWTPVSTVRIAVAARDRGWFEDALTRLMDAGQVETEEGVKGLRMRLMKGVTDE